MRFGRNLRFRVRGTLRSNNKAKYDAREAEVITLLSKHVKVIMLDGPAKGEKRKFPYDSVTAASAAKGEELAQSQETADPSAAPAAQASAEPSAAPAAQASAEPSAAPAAQAIAGAAASSRAAAEKKEPDAVIKALFGNLKGFE